MSQYPYRMKIHYPDKTSKITNVKFDSATRVGEAAARIKMFVSGGMLPPIKKITAIRIKEKGGIK